MPAPQTPNPVGSSTMSSWPLDTVISRYGPIGVTYSTAPTTNSWVAGTAYSLPPAAIVTAASGTNQFSQVTVSRTVYAPLAPTAVTTFVGATSTAVITYTQHASTPVVVTSVTQYGIVIPTFNNTVYGSNNTAQNLMTLANDIVSLPNQVVVTDREA